MITARRNRFIWFRFLGNGDFYDNPQVGYHAPAGRMLEDDMTNQSWTPGEEVEIVASRVRLRSLRPDDVPEDRVPSWYGDKERRKFIWSPDMDERQFLRKLSQVVDNRNFFALLAIERSTGNPIGLVKGQVAKEGQDSVFVITTLIGDPTREGLMRGYEMTSATLWFATTHLPIDAISMRIYEGNESVAKMVELSGYELHHSYEEATPGGTRRVLDFRKGSKDWVETFAKRFGHFVVSKAER